MSPPAKIRLPCDSRSAPALSTGEAFTVRVVFAADRKLCTLTLAGDFDATAVPAFQQAAGAAFEVGCWNLDVNLAGLRFADSTALGALVTASYDAEKGGGIMVILRCSPFLRRVLSLLGWEAGLYFLG